MNIDQIRKKYSRLSTLFRAYFYPEWDEDHNTEEDVVIYFVQAHELDALLETLLEIEELKRCFPEDERLKKIIEDDLGLGYGLCFEYLKMTGVEWLDFIASIVTRELNKRKNNLSA